MGVPPRLEPLRRLATGTEENESFGKFRFSRDFGGVFGVPANNVFLVKLSYWLNY